MSAGGGAPTPGNIVVVAALPRELNLLVRALGAKPVHAPGGVQVHVAARDDARAVVLATAGMGPGRVALAVEAALGQGVARTLFSVGLAGACDPALRAGDVFEASAVIESGSGERFLCATPALAVPTGALVSVAAIATPAEKRRLRASYGAAAVDMEAATVARLARGHGVAFTALKAISDGVDADLSRLTRFADARGQFRTGAFAAATALRPWSWREAVVLGRESQAALRALTGLVLAALSREGAVGA